MEKVKAVVVGNEGVGKTSLLVCYTSGSFPEDYTPTIFDNFEATAMVDGRPLKLELWDTAGRPDHNPLRPTSYAGTDVFLVAFAVVDRDSFDSVRDRWLPEIRTHVRNPRFIVVGLKSDLRDVRRVLGPRVSSVSTAEVRA